MQRSKSYSRDDALCDLRAIRERQGDEQLPDYLGGGLGPAKIQEDDHLEADDVLLRLIDDPAIQEAFHSIGKWYA